MRDTFKKARGNEWFCWSI